MRTSWPMKSILWLMQTQAQAPASDAWLSPTEHRLLAGLRFPKRRLDWRLGRWTAKRALCALLAQREPARVLLEERHAPLLHDMPGDCTPETALAAFELRAGATGAPEMFWREQPLALALSLSHSEGSCVAALAPEAWLSDEVVAYLGGDLEAVQPRSALFLADYFTSAEQALVLSAAEAGQPLLTNLLWSAKESCLKALRQGLRRDPRSVEVQLSAPAAPLGWQQFTAQCHETGRRFHGWWQPLPGFVLTLVTHHITSPPLELSL